MGIDGQVEMVVDGYATGCLMAVQIKSGKSYLVGNEREWHFHPEPKHRLYWEKYPIPVILCIHDPTNSLIYWTDARQQLRSPETADRPYIAIPHRQRLDKCTPEQLFEGTAAGGDRILSIPEVLQRMVQMRLNGSGFRVSYLQLFAHGLINICRSLYFNMDIAMWIAEHEQELLDNGLGVGLGSVEQEFVFGYVKFLVQQNIAIIDYSDCLIDWEDRQLQPKFIAPLTSRGRELIRHIDEREDVLRKLGQLKTHHAQLRVAQESLIELVPAPSLFARLGLVHDFLELVKNAPKT